MGKKGSLVRKMKKPECAAMMLVVVALLIVGGYFLVTKNKLLGVEGFTGSMEEKPNPGPNDVYLVLFFVKWCPHCTAVKPEWEKLMKLNNTKVNGKTIKIQAANAEGSQVEKDAARDNNVEGYPTIKLISQSQVLDYNGSRNAEEMGKFVKDYCGKN